MGRAIQARSRKEERPMRKVVHFEIPADDVERAKDFYGSIFGWQLQTMPMGDGSEYTIVMTTPVDEQTQLPTELGAINGGMVQRSEWRASPVITVDVDDIGEALRAIEARGGTTLSPRTEIGPIGAVAYFEDPEGNVMGLWESSA
ncbi:MAG TPA: VOC family protein [Actinomycetota bacterium]|nr:VOC family protein [Actinomycetota bacterium]